MIRNTFALFFLIISLNSYSQNFTQEKNVTTLTKITFLGPSISHEKAIGKFQTIYGQAYLATYFSWF
jgi:Zn-dependent oligopeptidase